jgi:hypothetical protein
MRKVMLKNVKNAQKNNKERPMNQKGEASTCWIHLELICENMATW